MANLLLHHTQIKRYRNHFDGYSTTYEVWDDYYDRKLTDKIGDIWRRRCIIQLDELPYIYIILPYSSQLEPNLFRQHLIHLLSSIQKRELYYFDHTESIIRFCTAIGYNAFTPIIDMSVSGYNIHKDMKTMGIDFHMNVMTQYTKMYEILPSFIQRLLDTMSY
jgi:hypothetical protein